MSFDKIQKCRKLVVTICLGQTLICYITIFLKRHSFVMTEFVRYMFYHQNAAEFERNKRE